jgi:carbon-monoxide dehydrogenase medium subunit
VPWPAGSAAVYLKFGIHERPTLGVALALVVDGAGSRVTGARLAVGCVDPRPRRVPAAEARLRGAALAELEDAAGAAGELAAAAVEPDDDLHGSADYKREMVAVFVRRALRIAVQRARGGATAAPSYPYTVIA